MHLIAQRGTPAKVAAQAADHDVGARGRLVELGLLRIEAPHMLGPDRGEVDRIIAKALAQQATHNAHGAPARVDGQASHLCHVLVEAAQLFDNRRHVDRLAGNGAGAALHAQEVDQRSVDGTTITKKGAALASWQVAPDELVNERLDDLAQAPVFLPHPRRQVRDATLAYGNVGRGVPALDQAPLVGRQIRLECVKRLAVVATTGLRRMFGAHGGLQKWRCYCTRFRKLCRELQTAGALRIAPILSLATLVEPNYA